VCRPPRCDAPNMFTAAGYLLCSRHCAVLTPGCAHTA
jgi:hypothetical protein